jgi:hypothetical protein
MVMVMNENPSHSQWKGDGCKNEATLPEMLLVELHTVHFCFTVWVHVFALSLVF